jgi:Na+/phosphate symporter
MDYANLSLAPMLIGLAGGLALFLHGMTMMSNALERALTESLRGAYSLTRRFVRVGSGLVHMPAQDA